MLVPAVTSLLQKRSSHRQLCVTTAEHVLGLLPELASRWDAERRQVEAVLKLELLLPHH